MGIYLDVVMVLNFLVDFFLLLGTDRLTGFRGNVLRCAMGALVGSFYGGVCAMPRFYFLGSPFWRWGFLVLIAGIAFGWNRNGLRRGAVFVLLSMALGGIATGIGKAGFGMIAASAVGVWLLCRLGFRGQLGEQEFIPVELNFRGKRMVLTALRDTGNQLRDPATGEQVLVAGADVAEELLGLSVCQLQHPLETLTSGGLDGLRLIPYRAVGQPGSMLLARKFHNVKLGNTYSDALVAFAPEVLSSGGVYRMLTGGAV